RASLNVWLSRDRAPQLGDVACNGGWITVTVKRLLDDLLDAAGEGGRRRDNSRTRQRHMLPSPGFLFVIVLEGLERRRDRSGSPRRSQPHVDLVETAILRF